MNSTSPKRLIFRVVAILIIVTNLLGLRFYASLAAIYKTYLPIVSRNWPIDPPYASPLLITEVFYDPPEPEPELEWYEIYNRADYTIDLTRYKIGDGETKGDHESMYIFPDHTSISPGQVVVIATRAASFTSVFGSLPDYEIIGSNEDVPNMSKYRKWATGNSNLSNGGDEVLILNEEDIIIDAVSWKDSTFAFDPSVEGVSEGFSIARKPADYDSNRASDWVEPIWPSPGTVDLEPPTPTPTRTRTPTLTATSTPTPTPVPCGQADLLISEVLYDPTGSEDPLPEWIEIINNSFSDVNLACVKIGDEETRLGGEGMLRFPEGALLHSGDLTVVANRASSFWLVYGFLPDFEMVDSDPLVTNMVQYDEWADGNVNLSNEGDEVLLMDGNEVLIDAVSWGNSAFAFTPPVDKVDEGHSIERFPANFDSNSALDWRDQPNPTPGKADIILPTSTATLTVTVELTPSQTTTPKNTHTPTPTNTMIPCGIAELLISEVLYNPAGVDDPYGEWIEVINPSVNPVFLGCVKIGDEEILAGGEGMFRFPEIHYLVSGEVIVIANQATAFFSQYGFFPDYELVDTVSQVPNMLKYSTWASGSINLSNSGDDVLLLNGDDQIIDAVSWDGSSFAFVPPVSGVDEGHSIERRPANYDSDKALDWVDQSIPAPGQVDFTMPTPTFTPTKTPSPTRTPTRTPTATRTLTPSPTQPSIGKWVINEIHSDPDPTYGDANGDGSTSVVEDEFVEIVNISASSIDISGWKFHDAGAMRHTFPAGSIVAPGCSVLIFGGGFPTGNFGNSLVQISSSGNLGLNDRIEIVTLFDRYGVEVVEYSYGLEGGENQSITRDPDIVGLDPLVMHSLASGSNGALFSPGTEVDGDYFYGCP